MPLTLSSAQSSTLEPIRNHRWVFQFASIPGASADTPEQKLAFAAHTAGVPEVTFNQTETQRLNETFYVAGKPTWSELSASFYDFIRGTSSAGQILYDWSQQIYNPITGQQFFKTQYSTSCTMAHLDPAGGIVRMWNIFYIWPATVGWGGEMSSEDDAVTNVTATLRYDYAVKATDVNTSPA